MREPLKLLEPIEIGKLQLRNRILMPAMGTNYADENGAVTERLLHYYTERAKGGVGLIIIEVTCVDAPIGKTIAHQLCVHEDALVPGLRALARSIQAQGAKVALQLHHAGRRAPAKLTGMQPVAPSSIACYGGDLPRELNKKEIENIVEKFVQGARRAQEAGFDAVEIHCAHGYLIHQFLSPLTNKRSDEYGGELGNRAKFPSEVMQRIRKEVGEDFPILVRISADEFMPGGLTLVEGRKIAQRLEKAGANLIHVSAGGTASSPEEYAVQGNTSIPDISFPGGCFVSLAQGIKERVQIPVIAVGRINDPDLAEEILCAGKADLVAMGRALIVDPEMPRKIKERNWEGIRRCIGCMTCADKILGEQVPMVCAVNPSAGKEKEFRIEKTKSPKSVLVIGGGPGGMEAARVLALRGHRVTLLEKSDELGGQLKWAFRPPHKGELRNLRNYLAGQLKELGVKVEVGNPVHVQGILEKGIKTVVIATGAQPITPKFDGAGKANLYSFVEALTDPEKIGKTVIILGGGLVGCETAEFLAQAGKSVTIIERLNDLAWDVNPFVRRFLLNRLKKLSISFVMQTEIVEIQEKQIIGATRGEKRTFQAEAFIVAMGMEADRSLANSCKALLPGSYEIYEIGDCLMPRKIIDAIHEGFSLGRTI